MAAIARHYRSAPARVQFFACWPPDIVRSGPSGVRAQALLDVAPATVDGLGRAEPEWSGAVP
jgi:hypothetical protein